MSAEHPNFADVREDFDLSMMTDKFKDEWIANSDWLKLNFHANHEFPAKPYKYTDYDTIYNDCKKVQNEIIRFAGKQTLSEETTMHWGECSKEGIPALIKNPVKAIPEAKIVVRFWIIGIILAVITIALLKIR